MVPHCPSSVHEDLSDSKPSTSVIIWLRDNAEVQRSHGYQRNPRNSWPDGNDPKANLPSAKKTFTGIIPWSTSYLQRSERRQIPDDFRGREQSPSHWARRSVGLETNNWADGGQQPGLRGFPLLSARKSRSSGRPSFTPPCSGSARILCIGSTLSSEALFRPALISRHSCTVAFQSYSKFRSTWDQK
jgi:hypothetical protein